MKVRRDVSADLLRRERAVAEYLIGIIYHDPETYSLWQRGVIEDYENSTGLFVEADSPEAAVAWGEHVGQALLAFVHRNAVLAGRVMA